MQSIGKIIIETGVTLADIPSIAVYFSVPKNNFMNLARSLSLKFETAKRFDTKSILSKKVNRFSVDSNLSFFSHLSPLIVLLTIQTLPNFL